MKILKENLPVHINLDGLTRSWSEKSHFNKSTKFTEISIYLIF